MKLKTIPYSQYEEKLPQSGNHILAQQNGNSLIVYQAFNPHIAQFAVDHQAFGGTHYKFSRMSWIKPNFLWMMYRCGWAQKEHQQRVLAIELSKVHFEEILAQAVHSNFKQDIYTTKENWKIALKNSTVRLQWDPDHNPFGTKLDRKAIQLGLRSEVLWQFGKHWILSIEDITEFVHQQYQNLKHNFEQLLVIEEEIYEVNNLDLKQTLMLH